MRVPIPNDWDGVTWDCYQIQWPSSVVYRAILTGLLSQMTRGRFWDETTGNILDTQAIAWEVFDRNNPAIMCNGELPPEQLPCIPNGGNDGSFSQDDLEQAIEELIDMAMITGAHWDKGVLYLDFGPCCSIPVKDVNNCTIPAPSIDDVTGDEEPTTPEDAIPDLEPEPGSPNWACRKAYTLGQTWADMVLAMQGARNMVPWQAQQYLQDQLTYLRLDNQEAYQLYLGIQIWERALPLITIEWTTEQTEQMICELATELDSVSSAMSSAEFDKYYEAVRRNAGGSIQGDMMKNLAGGVGRSNMRLAIQSGIFYDEASCECPEDMSWMSTLPDTYDWAYKLDWRTGTWGFVATTDMGSHVMGTGWQKTKAGAAEQMSVVVNSKSRATAGDTDIKYVQHLVDWGTGAEVYHVRYGWLCTDGNPDWDEQTAGKTTFSRSFADAGVEFLPGEDIAFSAGAWAGEVPSGNVFTLKQTIIAGNGDDPFVGIAKDATALPPDVFMGDH